MSETSSASGSVNPAVSAVAATTATSSPVIQRPKKSVDDFEFGEVVGEGSYGEVKIAVDKHTNGVYAAKILSKKQIVKLKKHKYVTSEKAILDVLRHPNTVQLYCTFQDKENLYFVMELCQGGDLLAHLSKVGAFDEVSARFYAAEVLSALAYMHRKCVAHRDLKPENVLLVSSMHAKISDFGCAKQFSEPRERSNSFCGTPEYVCPELLVDRTAGLEADMWSFGVMLYQMLVGKFPFKGITEYHTLRAVTEGECHYPLWLSSDAVDLIMKLLVRDPLARLTAEQAKAHPFFASIEWAVIHTLSPPPMNRSPFYVPPPSPTSSPVASPPQSPEPAAASNESIDLSDPYDASTSSMSSSAVY